MIKIFSLASVDDEKLPSIAERLWAKAEHSTAAGCWFYTAAKDKCGYGQIYVEGNQRAAHRVAYELVRGVVHPFLQLDHLCNNRACCNPAHLEPVTPKENTRRSFLRNPTRPRPPRTICRKGLHELTPENTVWSKGGRNCRECRIKRRRAERARKKAENGYA